MTRILITGASGFIGRHIVSLAIMSQRGEIHCASRKKPQILPAGVVWHEVDLRDPNTADLLIRQVKPSHVVHGAWEATPGAYLHSPENMNWLTASIALAKAFGETGGQRIVGLGTCAEYGVSDSPLVEDTAPLAPASIYGKCKLACWWGIDAAAQHYGFSAAWGRIFLPYGPGDSPKRLIPSLLAAISAGKEIPTTLGLQARDFVLSTDVADQLFRLLWAPGSGVFNIGTGEATQVRTAMELVADHFGSRHLLQFGARPMAPGETMCLVADMSKTERALGTIAPTGLADGIAKAVAEFHTAPTNKNKV